MNSRLTRLIFGCLTLFAGGAALARLEPGAPSTPAEDRPPTALFGGCRMLVADWLWLETNLAWEARDATKVRQLIALTRKADPGSRYFCLNGARMLAYDLPAWRCQASPAAPRTVQAAWREAGANEALALLERGRAGQGDSAALYLEMANISLYALRDRPRATEFYRLAAEQADAPDYAARIFARLKAAETVAE